MPASSPGRYRSSEPISVYWVTENNFSKIRSAQKLRYLEIDSDWLILKDYLTQITHSDLTNVTHTNNLCKRNELNALDLSNLVLSCRTMEVVTDTQEFGYKLNLEQYDKGYFIYHFNQEKVVMIEDHQSVGVHDHEVEEVEVQKIVGEALIVINQATIAVVVMVREMMTPTMAARVRKVADPQLVSLVISHLKPKIPYRTKLANTLCKMSPNQFYEPYLYESYFHNLNVVLAETIKITTRYCWTDRSEYRVEHSEYHKTRPARVDYELFVDDAGTKLADYNDINKYKDVKHYNVLFRTTIVSTKKRTLCHWLEDSGCKPDNVTLRKLNGFDFVHPHDLREDDRVEEIQFTDFVSAWVFPLKNLDKIQHGQPKHVWKNTEFSSFSLMQTRQNVLSHFSVVVPDIDELCDMLDKCVKQYPHGASPRGKVLPNMINSYEMKLNEIARQHEKTYDDASRSSAIMVGPRSYVFRYADCEESVTQATNPFRSDLKQFQPTESQCRKRDALAESNGWKDMVPNFQGNIAMFTKQGRVFQVTENMEPIVHTCNENCYRDCQYEGQPKLREIPHWSHILYSSQGHDNNQLRTLEPAAAFKLFRSIKYKFERDVMQIKFSARANTNRARQNSKGSFEWKIKCDY